MINFESIRLPWPGWKIVKYLGRGAYEKVYEIERNISGIQEKAALKIISIPKEESELEEDYQNGFDQESISAKYTKIFQEYVNVYKLMRELQGQCNIVSWDDFAVIPHENGIGGEIFIRMELLTPLQQVLRERALSVEEIIKLGKDISQALILCESKNIIHRDIKPANIMISEFGDFKLGDLGVSKIMAHTTFVTPMGASEYLAPEVVHMEKYGYAADIYSLGIVMYWLLNNRRMPFIGADDYLTPRKRQEAMDSRYRGERLPAPKNGSERLKQLVLKACAYRPEDRYASAKEMYDELKEPDVPEKPKMYVEELWDGYDGFYFCVDAVMGESKINREEEAEQLFEKIKVEKVFEKGVGIRFFDFKGKREFEEWMAENKKVIPNIDNHIRKNTEFAKRLYYKKCPNNWLLKYMKRLNPEVVKEIKSNPKQSEVEFSNSQGRNSRKKYEWDEEGM